MSDFAARQTLARLNLREVAVAAAYSTMQSDLQTLANINPDREKANFLERRGELCEAYGFRAAKQDKPFAFSNGIAIIPISGTLINRFGWSYGFVTGYQFVKLQLALALNDDDVLGIVFDVNSGGGEAAGCFECSNEIAKARGKKPTMAVIDSNCYSAAYALASACDKIVCTPSGGAGSIGVVAMHADMSKMLDSIGVKITFIHFGDHKVDGNPYEPLSADVKKSMQASIDKAGAAFVNLVAKNRGLEASAVKATEARCYRAEEALSLGLIDTIATPQDALQVFFDELTGSDQPVEKGTTEMTTPTNQPAATAPAATTTAAAAPEQVNPVAAAPVAQTAPVAAAPAATAADGAKAERARIGGITGCEEAKGKSTLANHLAMNTDMSVDAAKAVLAAAASEAPAAASAPDLFKQAMDTSKNPQVGAGAAEGAGAGGEQMTAAQRILADSKAVTGEDHKA